MSQSFHPAQQDHVSLTMNGTTYGHEDVTAMASTTMLSWAADFGLIEWIVDPATNEMGFRRPRCCDHDCTDE